MPIIEPICLINQTGFHLSEGHLDEEMIHGVFTRSIQDGEIPQGESKPRTPERLIELAQQEWKKWGELRAIVEKDNGRFCLLDPDAPKKEKQCYPEEKLHRNFDIPSPLPYSETECQIIARYWRAVGSEFNCETINHPDWPWSAAFISWLFVKAGFRVEEFAPADAHARYIVDARDQLLASGILKAEQVPGLPNKGDLICSVRGKRDAAIRDIYQIDPNRTLSHCDLVVEVNAQKNTIDVIGGNVHGVVARTTIELDASKTLNTQTNIKRPWLVILRNNRQLV